MIALFNHRGVSGSREACCVRMAQRMRGSGYVLLCEGDRVLFSAAVGSAYSLRRGAVQDPDHLVCLAADRGSAVSDVVRLKHPSGSETPAFAGQAVLDDGYVFAVLTDSTTPPWGLWRPPRNRAARSANPPEVFCQECDEFSEGWQRCDTAPSHRVCSTCGWCACRAPKTRVAEKRCDTCTMMRRIDLFPGGGNTCVDH